MRGYNEKIGVPILSVPALLAMFCLAAYLEFAPDTIILETNHLPTLLPHEHDAGEAVEDAGHHHYLYSADFTAPYDIWISKIHFDIMNAPDTAVHHTALLMPNANHQTCKNIPFKQLAGFAQDSMFQPTISFPPDTGMLIKRGETVRLLLMVHNPLPPVGPGGIYHNVSGRLTLTLHPKFRSEKLKEIRYHLMHLDEVPCAMHYSDGTEAFFFSVPPRVSDYEFSSTATQDDPAQFTFSRPSTIVYVGGHLHGWQGGKEVIVEKNGASFLRFTTTPSATYPYRYDSQYYPSNITVNSGDSFTVRAIYDNPNDVLTRGAMGMLEMYYYEN